MSFLNARSLTKKLPSFHSFVYSSLPDVIAVTETWLSDSMFNNEVLPNGYSVYRKDRQSRGGGLLIGTASHISSSFLYSQSDPDVLTVKLFLPFPIVICAVYIPPSATVDLQDPYYFISEGSIPVVMFQLLFLGTSTVQIQSGPYSLLPLVSHPYFVS